MFKKYINIYYFCINFIFLNKLLVNFANFIKLEVIMIYEKYIKDNFLFYRREKIPNVDLIKSIISTREDLENANKNFEFAEGELIDYYLYQIKATQSKYNYLLKKAKKAGIFVSRIDELTIKNLDEAI